MYIFKMHMQSHLQEDNRRQVRPVAVGKPSLCVTRLFVNLCKLVQVILKKGNLLLLGARPPAIIRFHFGTLQRRWWSRKMRLRSVLAKVTANGANRSLIDHNDFYFKDIRQQQLDVLRAILF